MTSAELKSEIVNDPQNLGLKALASVAEGGTAFSSQDATIADLLNSLSGNGTALVSPPSLDKNSFMANISIALGALLASSAQTQSKYQFLLTYINSFQGDLDMTNGVLQAFLGGMVTDSLLTSPQATAAAQRVGSRAEVLWGAGRVITQSDVSKALRGKS
jgi:hypothetical protein